MPQSLGFWNLRFNAYGCCAADTAFVWFAKGEAFEWSGGTPEIGLCSDFPQLALISTAP